MPDASAKPEWNAIVQSSPQEVGDVNDPRGDAHGGKTRREARDAQRISLAAAYPTLEMCACTQLPGTSIFTLSSTCSWPGYCVKR